MPPVSPILKRPSVFLKDCSKRYERFCQQHRYHTKGAHKCHWGSRMLKRLVETSGSKRSKGKRISPGQQQLPFAFDCRLNQIPEILKQIVEIRIASGKSDGCLIETGSGFIGRITSSFELKYRFDSLSAYGHKTMLIFSDEVICDISWCQWGGVGISCYFERFSTHINNKPTVKRQYK